MAATEAAVSCVGGGMLQPQCQLSSSSTITALPLHVAEDCKDISAEILLATPCQQQCAVLVRL